MSGSVTLNLNTLNIINYLYAVLRLLPHYKLLKIFIDETLPVFSVNIRSSISVVLAVTSTKEKFN